MKEQLQERKELLQIREVTKIFGGGTVNEKTALNSVNLTLQIRQLIGKKLSELLLKSII